MFAKKIPARIDPPREQLMALVASYGLDVLDMARTVESELHICCPGDTAEVNALVAALRHGVVHYLLVLAENGKLASRESNWNCSILSQSSTCFAFIRSSLLKARIARMAKFENYNSARFFKVIVTVW